MIRKLRLKFICINMAIVTAMLLVIFGMVLHFTQENLAQQSIGLMQSIVNNPGLYGKPEGPRDVQLPWFQVTHTPTGKQRIVSNGYAEQLEEEALQEAIRLARESPRQQDILKSHRLRFSKRQGLLGEQIIFVDISSELATMQSLVKTCVWVGLLSFGVFLILSILLARWAIRPVEQAWDRQRQFVADASHELKTPLAVILTNAELLQAPGYDEAARQSFSSNILTVSRQMRSLVESLLDLARLDSGRVPQFFQLDFSRLVSDALLPFDPLYFERQLALAAELEEGLSLQGNPDQLQQILDILLDNAAKYTAPGGQVRVCLRRQGNCCLLSVANPGDALSREELDSIFKRFYRIDKARSRDGSYGLGLSIAESIVTAHGGRIWAESEQGINTFFVQLSLR